MSRKYSLIQSADAKECICRKLWNLFVAECPLWVKKMPFSRRQIYGCFPTRSGPYNSHSS